MPPTLSIALAVPDTKAEGPGRRFAIWVQGCSFRCPGCCNPHYLSAEGGDRIPIGALLSDIVATPQIEGVTLIGGEPMQQAAALAPLLRDIQASGLSTMVFTGYTRQELATVPHADAVLAATDLLVDGRYRSDLPDETRQWIGSTNQVMHFLTHRYDPADPQFTARDSVEIRWRPGELTINGQPWGRWAPKPRRT